MKNIFLLCLFLSGCANHSHEALCSPSITFNSITREKQKIQAYNHQIDSFQYLLKHSVENMLVNMRKIPCDRNEALILNLTFQYESPYDYSNEISRVNKRFFPYDIKYDLISQSNKTFSGEIKVVDSFYSTTNMYSEILSGENSQLAAIANITQQLELELSYFIDNKFIKHS